MNLSEYTYRKIPSYYPSMYLDGFSPNEILMAARKKMLEGLEKDQPTEGVKIISEVKIK